MFNDYMWQTYLNAGGNKVVEKFELNLTGDFSEEYAEFIEDLHKDYCSMISDEIKNQLLDVISQIEYGYIFEEGEYSIEKGFESFLDVLTNEEQFSDKEIFGEFSDNIAYYSTLLALEIPDLFIPYYFKYNFNVLEKIAQEFDIELPPIPVKKDYKGRLYYYADICKVFYDFREKHNLSPYELCAFLYDFAPKFIGGTNSYIIKELPEPQSAFFIGGTKDDIFLENRSDLITSWQCSPYAKAGDIAVMYLKNPISAVVSHWRCVSDGFIDPFFYYYRCAYISDQKSIKKVTQSKLERDKIFKNFPLVRKNMQGVNGFELSPSQYNHLMDLASADVCRLEYTITETGIELLSENDVKTKLIEPTIKKLGYSEKDYEKELHLEIGNHNNMIIPDYVLLPDKTRGKQSAFVIIEAKYHIANSKEFDEVKIQARSYARQCLAEYSVIADRNKIYISTLDDDYTDEVFTATWDELQDNDVFSKLVKLLGNRKRS